MSVQMKKKERPGQALRRVSRQHVDKALKHLQNANLPQAVHGVRKEIKKMRAVFRLARGGLGRKAYRKTAGMMRLAAKPLAASRDAWVTQRAFAAITGRKARQFPKLKSLVEAGSKRAERDFKDFDFRAVVRHLLEQVGDQLDRPGLKEIRWTDIRKRLEKSCRRGHEAYQLARQQPTPEHFHEWRKRVKYFYYQLEFLRPDWPPKTRALLEGLEKLGDRIGEDHDLVLLESFALEQCGPSEEAAELQRLIDARRKEHGAGIRQLGSRLYASPPEAVFARVEADLGLGS
jgi:CHAD domain-containing protein